ncbi:2-hydroxy-3-oxopropionate reductase [Mycolicibacterium vanbaalenii]|uniref:2-hydroxy-3-oxopropionate reductase n=1 Tax=Mycolicibacterium vanbaalenii TaxID=110539 RepID=A0A5S9RAX7_MYCVN|nr:NAD(P)-dependent oxidoreductase [Mycolicibacterium vanbaalenii]CAA0137529.1 2-hydroxy-3-oxopropionate reductase [Mycolicibacterium vanbaalenii]
MTTSAAVPSLPSVAFIGLGNMGLPIATNISRVCPDLIAYDRDANRLLAAGAAGLKTADDICAMLDRDFDVVVVSVNTPQALTEVLTGPQSILSRPRRPTTVVDVGTTGPTVSREIAERLRIDGHRFVDAPVSGGIGGAQRGELTTMVGATGEDEAIDLVLRSFCSTVIYLGDAGLGAVAKLVNNALAIGTLGLVGEVLAYGEANGLPRATLIDVIASSSGDSRILRSKRHIIRDSSYNDAQFDVQIALKDLRLLLQSSCAAVGDNPPILDEVERLVASVADTCVGPTDVSVIAEPANHVGRGRGRC